MADKYAAVRIVFGFSKLAWGYETTKPVAKGNGF